MLTVKRLRGALWYLTPPSTIIVMVSFIGGGNQSTWRSPPTCHKSLTHFYPIMLYRVQLAMSGIRTHNFSADRH